MRERESERKRTVETNIGGDGAGERERETTQVFTF
jgi:hypothetical protein